MFSIFDFRKNGFLKLSAFLFCFSTIAGFWAYAILYYIVLLLLAIKLFVSKNRITIGNPIIGVLLLICGLSLALNSPPSFFRAWERLGVFTIVLLIVSPFFVSKKMGIVKTSLLFYILDVCVLFSIGSFFAYFLGINLFVRHGELQEISSGKFSGIMNHSMYLGPFAALSANYLIIKVIITKNVTKRYAFILGAICCTLASLLSASRIGLVAGFVAVLVMLFRFYQGRLSKALKILMIIVSLGIATFSIWGGFTDFLIQKQMSNEELGGVMYSRERKINARIEEFSSSPLFGVGYNVIDPSMDFVEYSSGQIEPGSSWLELLSMTGILGFVTFFVISIIFLIKAWRISNDIMSAALLAFLVFFLVHMLAEGWIYAPHNLMTILLWLIMSVIFAQPQKQLKNNKQ